MLPPSFPTDVDPKAILSKPPARKSLDLRHTPMSGSLNKHELLFIYLSYLYDCNYIMYSAE